MKMKKIASTFTLALAVLAAPFAARALTGDIYEIRPVEGGGRTANSALVSGEEMRFVVRLMSRDYMLDAPTAWSLKYTGVGSEAVDYALFRPALGIVVSGRMRSAEIYDIKVNDSASAVGAYTDIYCSYKVKPGDVALPVKLALEGSTETSPIIAGETDAEPTAQYYLYNSDKWAFSGADESGAAVEAVLCYASDNDRRNVTRTRPIANGYQAVADKSLAKAGFYVKSVRLGLAAGEDEDGDDIWTVAQGATEKLPMTTIGTPVEAVKLYAWAKDESVVEVAGSATEMTWAVDDGAGGTSNVTHKVLEITVTTDGTRYDIPVKGITQGRSTQIVLSPRPGCTFDDAGTMIEEYITRTVKCTVPPPPHLVVTTDNTEVTADGKRWEDVAKLTVSVSEPFPDDADYHEITIVPTNAAWAAGEKWSDYVRFAQTQQKYLPTSTDPPKVKIYKGETTADTVLYLYALRADDTTRDGRQILFEPKHDPADAAAAAHLTGTAVAAGVSITAARDVITKPLEGSSSRFISGEPTSVPVGIFDTYADTLETNKTYTLWVKYTPTSSDWTTITNLIVKNGELKDKDTGKYPQFSYTGVPANTYQTEIYVVSPVSGQESTHVTFSAEVAAPRKATPETTDGTDGIYNESDSAYVNFKITLSDDNTTGNSLYAFLKPSSNVTNEIEKLFGAYGDMKCIIGMENSKGIEIENGMGGADSPVTGSFRVRQGTLNGLSVTFSVVLCTTEEYAEDSVVTGYGSGKMQITVYNVAPTIPNVQLNGFDMADYADTGYMFPSQLPAGQDQTITPEITDVAYDKENKMVYKWTARNTSTGDQKNGIVTNTTAQIAGFKYNFPSAGLWEVKIQALDWDLFDGGASWTSAPSFTFKLETVSNPTVGLVISSSYIETETRGYIGVRLPYYDSEPLVVKLTVTKPAGANVGFLTLDSAYKEVPDGYPALGDDEYYVLFTGAGTKQVLIAGMDGTTLSASKGFTLKAEVVTETVYDKVNEKWSKYYNDAQEKIYVENVTPVCDVTLENTNAWKVAGGSATSYPIRWAIRSDVEPDFTEAWATVPTNGIRVSFSGCSNADTFYVGYNDEWSGEFVPNFGSEQGEKTVTLTITDKDGGLQSWTYLYSITPSKFLVTAANGPGGDSTMPLSRKYARQKGIGEGHVYISEGTFDNAESFSLLWNCGSLTKVTAYAFGYVSGRRDDGNLDGGRDIAIDMDGSHKNGETLDHSMCYRYEDASGRDSYFYGWITAGEAGGSDYTISVDPQVGAKVTPGKIELPSEKTGDEEGYAQAYAEAVFAREYNRFDNMGDINFDGIPDYFSIKPYGEDGNGALAVADGSGSELGNLSEKNDDDDYLPPNSTLNPGAMIPGATSGWQTDGLPFNAYREIRGYGEGLNYGMFKFDTDEDSKGWISTLDLTDSEKKSLMRRVLETRDAILKRRYEGRKGDYDDSDWTLVTNLLSSVVRNGSSAVDPEIVPEYVYTQPGDIEWTEVDGKTVWIHTYTNTSYEAVTVTNEQAKATNPIDETEYTLNPCDEIGLADINFGEWVTSTDLAAKNPALLEAQRTAAKAFIDMTWRFFYTSGTWGWTCENRTDPLLKDTDGDGMPDGYEYFIWYDAMIGTDTNRLAGCRFNLKDVESYDDVITPEDITEIYNPNVKHSWTKQDTDNDGIYDLEEFLIGTSPVHWDSDRDGLSDLYEVIYNINPVSASSSAHNGAMNADGDFMAIADLPGGPYSIYTAKDGTFWAFLEYQELGDPETAETTSLTGRCFKVAAFNTGLGGSPTTNFIPTTERTFPGTLRAQYKEGLEVLNEAGVRVQEIQLYHHQVHNYFGFDPRTGWYRSPGGMLSNFKRWEKMGVGGGAVNTAAFTALDEFRLLKYRYIVGLRDPKLDQDRINSGSTTMAAVLTGGTTNPNASFEESKWGDSTLTFSQSQHGADTDGDGVPDGWELYIGVSPNNDYTIAKGNPGYDALYWDGNGVWPNIGDNEDYEDNLTLVGEYAGTDSCGVYEPCESIYKEHPDSDTSTHRYWFNKFFPTDPRNPDTDGDGINDGEEFESWSGVLTYNRWSQAHSQDSERTVKHFSVYGAPTNSTAACVRGGGYNPCSIDTDHDGLPDPWERQYAGILMNGTQISQTDPYKVMENVPGDSAFDDIRAALAAYRMTSTNNEEEVEADAGYYVVMGMDGTCQDAGTALVIGSRDRDWDGDGLQNWQEYMVQAMRHLRYDDDKTPLMGRDSPAYDELTGKTVPGKWNGADGFLKTSYTEPFTDRELDTIGDELGYTNFAEFAKETYDYLGALGYFAAPPRDWDVAGADLNFKYMLPPKAYRKQSVIVEKQLSITDNDGNEHLLWEFVDSGEEYVDTAPSSVESMAVGNEVYYCAPVTNDAGAVVSYELVEPQKIGPIPMTVTLELKASRYVGTDPRLWDTDEDGLDDYWELYHGLNPILGDIGTLQDLGETITSTNDTEMAGVTATVVRNYSTVVGAKDTINDAYHQISAWQNGWIGWDNTDTPPFDPIKYPWMMGTADCDADGDGLRNEEEGLYANLTSPNAYHTDPSPLWMTDTTGGSVKYPSVSTVKTNLFSSTGVPVTIGGMPVMVTTTVTNSSLTLLEKPSYTALYYENELNYIVWQSAGAAYLAAFEENEGYDTDNNWRSDSSEMKNVSDPTSDPLDFSDPARRQSIWFGGDDDPGVAMSVEPAYRNDTAADLFKQFTVEAWVLPENVRAGHDQYVVSRASNYGGWDLINSNSVIRLNFALGIDADGMAFAEIQNSTEISCRVTGSQLVDARWVHLAATYDGSMFSIYVNGTMVASIATTLIPANGVTEMLSDPQSVRGFPLARYRIEPSVTMIGGRANGLGAFSQAYAAVTNWDGIATDFFKGSVDEVRTWDGARSAVQVQETYRTRFTTAYIKELRDYSSKLYMQGARRNDDRGTLVLPPELIQHYSFCNLPGAPDKQYLQQVPAGFAANVLAVVRDPDSGSQIDDMLKVGWWGAILDNDEISSSSAYTSPYVVPWIENTVGHLPRLCGSVADSVYWGEYFAGYTPASFHGLEKFSLHNAMKPYNVSYAAFRESYDEIKFRKLAAIDSDNDALLRKHLYDFHFEFSGTSDLVPVGSAFAKRLGKTDTEDGSWDGDGSEDAWPITNAGDDPYGDGDPTDGGIPEWAIALGYDTAEAYRRALAQGLLPDGSFSPDTFRNMVDLNKNGIPDWWEGIYNVEGYGANDDPDKDGLSVYNEYLISEGAAFANGDPSSWWKLDPLSAQSGEIGQKVRDYFLPGDDDKKSWYLGEIVGDHDFIEDWWEEQYAVGYVNSAVYDAHIDGDGAGWNNFMEARAFLWHGAYMADLADRYLQDSTEQHLHTHPMPAIGVKVSYNGVQDITARSLVVRTHSGASPRIDATFEAIGYKSKSSGTASLAQTIGIYFGDTVLHGFLQPGCIFPGETVTFMMRSLDAEIFYDWKCKYCGSHGTVLDGWTGWGGEYNDGRWEYATYHASKSVFDKHLLAHHRENIFDEETVSDYTTFAKTSSSADGHHGTIVTTEKGVSGAGTVIGTIDFYTGEYALDLAKLSGEGYDLTKQVFRASYSCRIGNEWPQTLWFSYPNYFDGCVKPGKNTVEAFIDLDGDGKYTPGEPFGVAKDVEVGWYRTQVVPIELTDTSPTMPRINLVSLSSDRTVVKGSNSGVIISGGDSDGASSDTGSSSGDAEGGTDGLSGTYRIVRTKVNDEDLSIRATVLTRTFVYDDRPYIHEGDSLSKRNLGLDWSTLRSGVEREGINIDDVLRVTYAVEKVQMSSNGVPETTELLTFVNSFNPVRGLAVPVSPLQGGRVISASPTFSWTTADDTMTAFRLQVRDEDGSVVYDSGFKRMPASVRGIYAYTPEDLYVDTAYTNGAPVFADGADYQWRVALMNPKFSTIADDDEGWSEWNDFTVRVDTPDDTLTGYGSVAATVRYFGPGEADNIVVEAYDTPDLTGAPLARTRVEDVSQIRDRYKLFEASSTNALMRGVAPGDVYLTAFIDRNNNGVRDPYESWGYANRVDEVTDYLYNPKAVAVKAETFNAPKSAVIYLEDTDINQNGTPDALEDVEELDAAVEAQESADDPSDSSSTDTDGDGLPSVDESEVYGTDPLLYDTDGDGMPDGWEALFAGTDPTVDDADFTADGDVMAYREVGGYAVTVWDGTDEASCRSYLLAYGANETVPVAGDDASAYTLATWYDYNGVYGYGTNVASSALSGLKVYEAPKAVTVALVHAQVYDIAGFSHKTCVVADDAVDTKPFTAIDKMLVVRYLESQGRTPAPSDTTEFTSFEAELMASGDATLYAQYTLKPGVVDADHDGMADGWELYVMAGPSGAASVQTGVSPWVFGDRDTDLDDDGLANVGEYDSGYLPTDPWNRDSDGDGINDADALANHFKYGEADDYYTTGYRGDWDNDQLSNLIEYMISGLDGFQDVNASRMATAGKPFGGDQLVPDYFLPHGSLYLGEMFTDHDMIEDWWEDKQPVEEFAGSSRREGVSRYAYDAHADRDGDGWSNWAEARAWFAAGTTNVVAGVTVDEEGNETTNYVERSVYDTGAGRPTPTVPVRIVYNGLMGNLGNSVTKYTVVIKAWSQENDSDPDMSGKPDVTWSTDAPNQNHLEITGTLMAEGRGGYLREGKNMFVAYVVEGTYTEEEGVPEYTPGLPYGVATGVNVSYLHGDPFTIEMTDVNPSIVRVSIPVALNAQAAYAADTNDVACYDTVYGQTDRGLWKLPYASLIKPVAIGTNTSASASNVLVRVLRSRVNGNSSYATSTPILERTIRLSERTVLTEADLMAEFIKTGKWDLDWGNLEASFGGFAYITNADYRIVVLDGTVSRFDYDNNLAVVVQNRFDYGSRQPATADRAVAVNAGQPTFSWTHTSAIGKAYPAFRLRVWAKDGGALVYDSGNQPAPARDGNGRYSWTAPLWTGMLTAQGVEFKAETDYVWGVSMLDAKFTKPLEKGTYEGLSDLRMRDTAAASVMSDYGQIAVAVKYMGPGHISTTNATRLIRVEAYAWEDFSGLPYSVTYVKNTAGIAATNAVSLNARLMGLPKGRSFYVRAFLDTNGNGEHDDWESWGYGNYVGDPARLDVYTPRAYGVSLTPEDDLMTPECVIYIEDADTNNNKLPDVWEWERDGQLGGAHATGSVAASPYIVSIDGSNAVATNIFAVIESGAAELPYYSALTQMSNDDSLASVSLALAMAGVDLGGLDVRPQVKITSFSLDDGITLEVDPRATVDGKTLQPSIVTVGVNLAITVECAEELSGKWSEIGRIESSFDVGIGFTKVPEDVMADINDSVREITNGRTSCFFRARVSVSRED